jgi:hypothetical protein
MANLCLSESCLAWQTRRTAEPQLADVRHVEDARPRNGDISVGVKEWLRAGWDTELTRNGNERQ